MREINECTAEVFRRSEKRIKERKRNRNRILMCCIPLLICITVFSTAILPAMMPAKKGENLSDNCSDMAGWIKKQPKNAIAMETLLIFFRKSMFFRVI